MSCTRSSAWLARLFVIALACGAGLPAAAGAESDLYRASAVVSGQGEENRAIGLAQCLEDVLVKVSGDPRLMTDRNVAELKRRAGEFVDRFAYRDRMSGVPIHDEQGSYDRPHDLSAEFDVAKIDEILRSLGRQPWLSPRPRVVVFLAVFGRKADFALASDGDADMRTSLAAAAARVGLPMALPTSAQLEQRDLNASTLSRADVPKRETLATTEDVALAGTLQWSDEALGWVASWRMRSDATDYRWQIRGVGFDDSFRNGMRGAAQVLSGHGKPQ